MCVFSILTKAVINLLLLLHTRAAHPTLIAKLVNITIQQAVLSRLKPDASILAGSADRTKGRQTAPSSRMRKQERRMDRVVRVEWEREQTTAASVTRHKHHQNQRDRFRALS